MTDTASDALRRARLLEEACDFVGAARAALEGGDARLAARLAALGQDEVSFADAERMLCASPQTLSLTANDLASRGLHTFAGRLFELGKDDLRAGESFAAAGDPARAALAFERAGKPAEGARALERALRDDSGNDALRLALAELLARHGRLEPAVRALQAIRAGTEERARALPLLARTLASLGLTEAAREVEGEMKQLGLDSPPRSERPDRTSVGPPSGSSAARRVLFGRFEVVRDIARTPHAHVVQAIDRVTTQEVAVKLLVSLNRGAGRDAQIRFEREARALLRLRHPSMVSLVAYLPEGPAMVLEWMSGGSLADLMQKNTFAPARAAEIAISVLGALGEAHRLGILHRDVKPTNVLFDEIGSPRLADFGAAHFGDLSTTVTAGAIGTFSYMAPEQREGKAAGVQSDIYATGAILYEMLTGEHAEPQEGGFLERPPSAYHEDLGPRHDEVVAALLAFDPRDRPEDTFAARRLIEGLTWSTRVLPRTGPQSGRTRSSRPPEAGQRLVAPQRVTDPRDAARTLFDVVFERNVLVLPLDEPGLRLASAFARADHASLALVLRASQADGEIWIEPPRGMALADGARKLDPAQVERLRAALAALHAQGGAHGAIDAEHVYLEGDAVVLTFPRELRDGATPNRDVADLAALVG